MLKKVLFCAAVAAVATVAAACPGHWEMSGVHIHPHTASVVPAVVSFDNALIGWPTYPNNKCDQIIAMGVDDGRVRGVSTTITAGFSLPYIGDKGEEIEFMYWDAVEDKEYYSEQRVTFDAHHRLGSFKEGKEFVLVLRETPYIKPVEQKRKVTMDVALKFEAPLEAQQLNIVKFYVCSRLINIVEQTWGADTTATCKLHSTDSGRRLLEGTTYKVIVTIVTAASLADAVDLTSLGDVERTVEEAFVPLKNFNGGTTVVVDATASLNGCTLDRNGCNNDPKANCSLGDVANSRTCTCDVGYFGTSSNLANNAPFGGCTDPCPANQRVESNACVACPAGKTNVANDDARGSDTTCDECVVCQLMLPECESGCEDCKIVQPQDCGSCADAVCFDSEPDLADCRDFRGIYDDTPHWSGGQMTQSGCTMTFIGFPRNNCSASLIGSRITWAWPCNKYSNGTIQGNVITWDDDNTWERRPDVNEEDKDGKLGERACGADTFGNDDATDCLKILVFTTVDCTAAADPRIEYVDQDTVISLVESIEFKFKCIADTNALKAYKRSSGEDFMPIEGTIRLDQACLNLEVDGEDVSVRFEGECPSSETNPAVKVTAGLASSFLVFAMLQ